MDWCNVNNLPHYTSTPSPSFNALGDTWGVKTSGMTGGISLGYDYQFQSSRLVIGG